MGIRILRILRWNGLTEGGKVFKIVGSGVEKIANSTLKTSLKMFNLVNVLKQFEF